MGLRPIFPPASGHHTEKFSDKSPGFHLLYGDSNASGQRYLYYAMRLVLISIFTCGALAAATGGIGAFDKDVRPILSGTCSGCHNDKLSSGGLNVSLFLEPGTIQSKRDGWERILAKLRAGEMPPPGIPKPPAEQMDALIKFVQSEFDRDDKIAKIDPGRLTAHRLNRSEYEHTIKDLLGLDFQASAEFPADDSGYGFDNIGDVLTVSPTLMAKYLSVAEHLAARAVGGDPLPKPGFFSKRDRMHRLDAGDPSTDRYPGVRRRLCDSGQPHGTSRRSGQAGNADDFGGWQAGQNGERAGADQRGKPTRRRHAAKLARGPGFSPEQRAHLPRRIRRRCGC